MVERSTGLGFVSRKAKRLALGAREALGRFQEALPLPRSLSIYSFTVTSVGPDSVAFMRTVALGLATSPVQSA